MTKDEAVKFILAELERAEKIHPVFPSDIVHMGAIVAEEAGELIQACINNEYHGTSDINDLTTEAIQTGAMTIRFLINL